MIDSTLKLERQGNLAIRRYKQSLVSLLNGWFGARRLRRLEAERARCLAALQAAKARGDCRDFHAARAALNAATHACLKAELSTSKPRQPSYVAGTLTGARGSR